MKKRRNKHIGSSLDDFLKEEGILEETRAVALKEGVTWQVQQTMEKEHISTKWRWHGACVQAAPPWTGSSCLAMPR